MIKKPFRFLKNLMRWYEKEGENVLRQIRSERITRELWEKAEDNFNKRGLPIPMYENHNEEAVVGQVYKIEARDDGLYVAEHELDNRGLELVKNGEYPLPSGDFVLHYDDDDNIIDLEVFGVSLVNNEGAKDVELVTMGKDGERLPVSKIKIKGLCGKRSVNQSKNEYRKKNKIKKIATTAQTGVSGASNNGEASNKLKEIDSMDKEEVYAYLLEDEKVADLPDDVLEKIAQIRGEDLSNIIAEAGEEEEALEDEEGSDDLEESEDDDELEDVEGEDSKEVVKENAKKEAHEKEKAKEKKAKQSKKILLARMSRLKDAIAKKEYEESVKVVPSSEKNAKKLIERNYMDIPENKLISLALNQCSFFGGVRSETVKMKKSRGKKTPDDIILGGI